MTSLPSFPSSSLGTHRPGVPKPELGHENVRKLFFGRSLVINACVVADYGTCREHNDKDGRKHGVVASGRQRANVFRSQVESGVVRRRDGNLDPVDNRAGCGDSPTRIASCLTGWPLAGRLEQARPGIRLGESRGTNRSSGIRQSGTVCRYRHKPEARARNGIDSLACASG
jgi:hypothetical protein